MHLGRHFNAQVEMDLSMACLKYGKTLAQHMVKHDGNSFAQYSYQSHDLVSHHERQKNRKQYVATMNIIASIELMFITLD